MGKFCPLMFTFISSLEFFSEAAFHLKVNTFSHLSMKETRDIAVNNKNNNVFKQNTSRLFSIKSCQVGTKPFDVGWPLWGDIGKE